MDSPAHFFMAENTEWLMSDAKKLGYCSLIDSDKDLLTTSTKRITAPQEEVTINFLPLFTQMQGPSLAYYL